MSRCGGKWGRPLHRKHGRPVVVHMGMAVVPNRTPGVIYQSFFSSPLLAGWFALHDDEIDARLYRAEHEEYLRNLRLSREYRARKIAAARKASKRKARAV